MRVGAVSIFFTAVPPGSSTRPYTRYTPVFVERMKGVPTLLSLPPHLGFWNQSCFQIAEGLGITASEMVKSTGSQVPAFPRVSLCAWRGAEDEGNLSRTAFPISCIRGTVYLPVLPHPPHPPDCHSLESKVHSYHLFVHHDNNLRLAQSRCSKFMSVKIS